MRNLDSLDRNFVLIEETLTIKLRLPLLVRTLQWNHVPGFVVLNFNKLGNVIGLDTSGRGYQAGQNNPTNDAFH